MLVDHKGRKKIHLKAKTVQEKDEWAEAIQKAIDEMGTALSLSNNIIIH